jgi:hypothetical protein
MEDKNKWEFQKTDTNRKGEGLINLLINSWMNQQIMKHENKLW